eukprot:scaffold4146_cov151-Skeletonema_menzelii.AAC.1
MATITALRRPLLSINRQAPLSSIASRQAAALSTTRETPFYGRPLPQSTRYTINDSSSTDSHQQHTIPPLTGLQRLGTLLHSSLTALNDPTRADAVAAVGEVTGSYALSKILVAMEKDPVGRRILVERPLVDDRVATRAEKLLEQHHINLKELTGEQQQRLDDITFGAAYATFLQTHNFHPNERSKIRFLSDPNLSYVMTRYRQNHDYWHVLTGLPPTVLGELALKWLELIQTGLPLAALSATGGTAVGITSSSSLLSSQEREVLWEVYFPWAIRVGSGMRENALMCTYYEEELETGLSVLRERLGVEVAPRVDVG